MSANSPATSLINQTPNGSVYETVRNQTTNGMIDHRSSSSTIFIQIMLIGLLAIFSIFGNSLIVILLKRFPALRTISNITLANMAVVDVLNIVTNLPGFALVGVYELDQVVRGKAVSLFMGISQAFFNNMKVFCMLVMMIDRYFAISSGMRYKVWMSYEKMSFFMVLVWVLGISTNIPWFLALSKIDLGDAPTKEYRIVYFQRVGKTASFYVFSISGLAITVICLLTRRSFMNELETFKQREENGQDPQGTQLRKELTRRDARAAITIVLTIAAYLACYMPAILYAAFVGDRSEIARTSGAKWFGFTANFFLFVSSACNPLIYLWRSSRLRSATRCFIRSPCESDDFCEYSQDRVQHQQVQQESRKRSLTSSRSNRIKSTFKSEAPIKKVWVKNDAFEGLGDEAQLKETAIFDEKAQNGEMFDHLEESGISVENTFSSNNANHGYEDEGSDEADSSTSYQACEVSGIGDECETSLKQEEEAGTDDFDCVRHAS